MKKFSYSLMYKYVLKRVIDFILVLIILVVVGPILLLITIWLHFANKGAGAFFTQERPKGWKDIPCDKVQDDD